jgi:GT2 family glycosyltransferase
MDACVVVPTLGERPEMLMESLKSIEGHGPGVQAVVVAPADRCEAIEPVVAKTGGVLLEQAGSGQSDAINQGWAECGSAARWLTWLGDDDLLEPRAIQRCIVALEQHPTASMAWGAVRYIDVTGGHLFVFRPPPFYGPRLMRYGHNLVQQPGSLLRRTAVEAVGPLDVELRFAMDLDLFLRLSAHGAIVRLKDVVASFRWHDNSLTAGQGAASQKEASTVRQRYRPQGRADDLFEQAALAMTHLQYWWAKR